MLPIDRYTDKEILINQFKHIEAISSYNYNFYEGFTSGFSKDLLLAISDDDNTSEWYVEQNHSFIKIGESYTSDREEKIYTDRK